MAVTPNLMNDVLSYRMQWRSQDFFSGEQNVQGVWGTEFPSGVQGRNPGGGLGLGPQKLMVLRQKY